MAVKKKLPSPHSLFVAQTITFFVSGRYDKKFIILSSSTKAQTTVVNFVVMLIRVQFFFYRVNKEGFETRLYFSFSYDYSDICERISMIPFCSKGVTSVVITFKFQENFSPSNILFLQFQ